MQLRVNYNPRSKFFICLAIIFLFSAVSISVTSTTFLVTDEIYHGVQIADVPLGGKTRFEAEQILQAKFLEKTRQPIVVLTYQDMNWNVMAGDIDLKIDAQALANQAYNVGRRGSLLQKVRERLTSFYHGYEVPLKLIYDEAKLQRVLQSIAKSIERESRNASIVYEGSSVQVTPSISGRTLDLNKNLVNINTALNSNLSKFVQLVVDEIQPEISTDDLSHINGIIAAYTTQFDANDVNRTENILLAAKNIDGVLVRSGAIFSFNTYVGPRLSQYGYKEAPVFVDGKLIPDWGGGVCQVSSTLYNAALLADMTIEERSSHFRPPGYVPLGQDATVADNLLDFKFKNATPNNIYIKTITKSGQLTVIIFGKISPDMPDIRVISTDKKVVEPNIIIKQDPTLDVGNELVEVEGQKGYQVTIYRVKSKNGKELTRELISYDEFKPTDKIVRIGTKTPLTQQLKK